MLADLLAKRRGLWEVCEFVRGNVFLENLRVLQRSPSFYSVHVGLDLSPCDLRGSLCLVKFGFASIRV